SGQDNGSRPVQAAIRYPPGVCSKQRRTIAGYWGALMNYKQAVGRSTIRMYDLIPLLLSDLSDPNLLVRPVPGANHIGGQLGHLIIQECHSIGPQDLGVKYPELPKGFVEQHSDATAGVDPPSGFLTKAEYLDLLAQTHEATMETLASLSDA